MEITILICIFRNGDYNEFAWNMAAKYYHLAEAYLKRGDSERALSALEEMARFSLMDVSCPSHAEHTSYLVDHIVYDRPQNLGSCGSPEDYLEHLDASRFDAVRDGERFAKVIKTLANADAAGSV